MFQMGSWFGYGSAKPTGTETTKEGEADKPENSDKREEVAEGEKSESATEERTGNAENEKDAFGKTIENIDANIEVALNSAKEWGSYLFTYAKEGSKIVTDTATKTAGFLKDTVEEKTILGDFHKEQNKFVKENAQKRSDAAVPPWVGYNEEEQMKKQIMALSQDKRNFLRNPPAGVQYNFDFDSSYPVAMATLAEDPNLERMRFELVPKQIKEHNFWKNYFYRVSLIKQSSQLTSIAAESGESTSRSSSRRSSTDKDSSQSQAVNIAGDDKKQNKKDEEDDMLPPDSPTNEFVSDAFNSDLDHDDIQKGMKQLGMEKTDGQNDAEDEVPEWEKELQQELQEYEVVEGEGTGDNEQWEDEINQMLEDETQ